jgi:HNH endonuclease
MPLGWEELAALNPAQQRRLLLERTASSEADRKNFWRKAKVGSPEECWPWLSTKFNDGDGYGQVTFCVGPKDEIIKHRFRAHRVAFFLTHNLLPDDLCVCHKCDNPICVNPNHLFLGTNRKNIQDRTEKKRDAKGEQHGMHKLTAEEVKEIRHLRETHKLPYSALGKMFGVSTTHAGWIVRREAWKHLK